jgi:hypothetical protein
MGDKIITLSLTQREVDALYSASHFVAGQPNGMRNVFFVIMVVGLLRNLSHIPLFKGESGIIVMEEQNLKRIIKYMGVAKLVNACLCW